jgi:DNA-directed RNA polymerase subunit RPC12/RpoP
MPEVDVQLVDAEAAAPHGEPCPACGAPVEPLDKFCPACGTPRDVKPAQPAALDQKKYFRCQNCGSEVAKDPDHRSYVCPFCDSTYVVEFSPSETGRQPPEFVIGFAVTPEDALEKFRQWIKDNSWFRPGDLAVALVADKLRGIYLPFWSFSMLAESTWTSRVGEHWYRTETYTTTDSKGNTTTHTRTITETEWWPLSGRHHSYYSGYLVSGSRGLPQGEALRIQPFQLPALRRYEPYFLAGWLSEEYSVPAEAALKICQDEFYRREQGNISAFQPGDTHADVRVNTIFRDVSSDLCLLPVYVLSYKYKEKLFRFLVNGQTGKMAGDKPLSWRRIGLFIAAILILVLLVVLVILGLSFAGVLGK